MAPPTSLRSVVAYASNLVSQFPMGLSNLPNPLSVFNPPAPISHGHSVVPYEPLSGAPTCPIDGPISCNNNTAADSCCFVHPGGRLLLTQFWDEKVHVGGSEEDWTVHGLWFVEYKSGNCVLWTKITNLGRVLLQARPLRWVI